MQAWRRSWDTGPSTQDQPLQRDVCAHACVCVCVHALHMCALCMCMCVQHARVCMCVWTCMCTHMRACMCVCSCRAAVGGVRLQSGPQIARNGYEF